MKSFASKKRMVVSGSGLFLILLSLTLFATLHPFSPLTRAHAADPQNDWHAVPLVGQDARNAGFSGGEGGQWMRSIKWSQADPNWLLMGTDVGGVYRSLDGGSHWQSTMVGWNDRGAGDFAFDPKNGNRALGVAGNGTSTDGGNKPGGIYLTTDKGASWKQVFAESVGPDWRESIAYDPSSYDANLGYCTVAYYDSSNGGIYKTTDGGSTWSKITDGYAGLLIAVHPTKGYVYLASNQNPNYGTADGFYKSTDGGKTFTNTYSTYLYGLAVSPADPDTVWVSQYAWVAVSHDAGQTFNITGNTGLPAANQPFQNVTVSPINTNYLSVWADLGNYNWVRYYSTDGGSTWGTSNYGNNVGGNFRKAQYQLAPYNVRNGLWAYSPTTANVVISNGGDWLTKSTDGGANYSYSNDGYNGVFIPTFNFDPTNPDAILMASKDYNSYHSTDGGYTWSYDQTGFDFGGYGFGGFALDSNVMWLGNDPKIDASGDPILEETTDGGKTWTNPQYNGANITVATNANKFGLVSYADPTNNDIGFIGGWRTTDHGASWSPMSGVDNVYTSNPTGNRELYGKNGNDVVTSSDHGATWTKVATVSDGIREIAYDQNNNRIWVATGGSLEKIENGSVSTVDIPHDQYNTTRVNGVAVDPGNPNIVYAANNRDLWTATNSVVRSTDGGATWENLTVTTPLASGTVSGGPHEAWWVEVNPKTHEAWVVTNCFGIWKIGAPGSSSPTPTPTSGSGGTGNSSFSTGFESGDPQPTWTNTVDNNGQPAGGSANIGGICCGLTGPEAGTRNETAHNGSVALMYSGSATNSSGPDYAYMQVFDLSSQNITIGSSTTLTYWIYPQSSSGNNLTSGNNSSCVAIDLIFQDGSGNLSNLRDSGATDQNGNKAHPASQCGKLTMDAWNQVTVNLGAHSNGLKIIRLDVAYDQPNSTGGYRGYIDDISIHN